MQFHVRDLRGEIVTLTASGEKWTNEPSRDTVDLTGLWAVPGLVDAHVHLSSTEADFQPSTPGKLRSRLVAELGGGVFVCFDKGWSDDLVLTLLSDPLADRPALQAAGSMIAGPGGYYEDSVEEVEPNQLASRVAEHPRSGGWVKLVGDWPRKEVGAVPSFDETHLIDAVQVAHKAGLRVAIHTMAPLTASMAVRAGVDSIEHGLYLTDEDIRLLGARGGAWVPTVCQMERAAEQVGHDRTGGRMILEGLDRVRSLAAFASESGVYLLTGSDFGTPAGSIGIEAIGLTRYGFTNDQAVDALTLNGYRYAGEDFGFGIGFGADVVGFARHPLEDIGTLSEPVFVMRRGRVLVDRRRT